MRLVLIETEPDACAWLAERIGREGFKARVATLGHLPSEEGALAGDAAVLDMGGSPQPACEFVRALRARGLEQPLIVLSGNSNWRDRVDSLDAGADDYLVKPTRAEEVAARLRAVIRRTARCQGERMVAGGFAVDLKARAVWLDGRLLDVTRDEFRLLRMFVMNPGRVHSNDAIRDALYPRGEEPSTNAVEVRIARLRRKIGHDRIRTIRGLGYRFVPSEGAGDPCAGSPLQT